MAKRPKRKTKKKSVKKTESFSFVTVKKESGYGSALIGEKIYFVGKVRPKTLSKDGKIDFGKNILEILKAKFGKKFRWVITPDVDLVEKKYGITNVKTSKKTLAKMYSERIERTRDIKVDIINRIFSIKYSEYFSDLAPVSYLPGTIAKILDKSIITRLSSGDRDALNDFLPDFISSESISSVNLLKAKAEIESLRELASDMEKQIKAGHSEAWWQIYIKKNILIIQQGYIKAIEKMNISIGDTKFPDFSLITHDNYLDILEIKKPDTDLLKYDKDRNNYYLDAEISRAVVQVENYIANVTRYGDAVRTYILDNYTMNIKAIKPRGIILAGDASLFTEQKEKDDFRLLAQSNKNIQIITYDEMLTRLQNYIKVLESFNQIGNENTAKTT